MRRQLPRPGHRETRGKEDEPRLADDAQDRRARQSAESYLHACPYSRTRTLPGRTVGRVPGVVRLSAASSPHLTTPASPSSLTLAILGEPVAFVPISKTLGRQQIALMFD